MRLAYSVPLLVCLGAGCGDDSSSVGTGGNDNAGGSSSHSTGGAGATGGTADPGGNGGAGATGGTGGTGGEGGCGHALCTQGEALDPDCDACVSTVCGFDDFCCNGFWDDTCIDEVEQSCAINCSGPCTAESCPDGCCDPDTGICTETGCQFWGVPCGGEDISGPGTGTCAYCSEGACESCTDTQCTVCTPNCENKACGDPDGCGSRCDVPCSGSQFCSISAGKCADDCNASTCADGCCDASGHCVRDQSDDACGAHGAACDSCPAGGPACVPIPGAQPQGGECQACDSTTCPDGCCTDDGHCDTSHAHDTCGNHGARCVDCTLDGSICSPYYKTCADCVPQCDGKACGESDGCGASCAADCPTGLTCVVGNDLVPDGCVQCNPTTCAWGCCDAEGKCQSGTARDACGGGGEDCFDCGDQLCDWGFISASCAACGANCPPPIPGQDFCVADGCGGICPGSSCQGGGTCQVTNSGFAQCSFPGFCFAFGCDGCCDSQGNCSAGNLPTKCGHDGVGCVDCIAQGETCDADQQACQGCVPSCAGKSCGYPDGCGGKCTGPEATCPDTSTCADDGTCHCGTGESLCYDESFVPHCVDTASNPSQCGYCNVECPAGVDCVDGVCDCPVGSHLCTTPSGDRVCTNLATDPQNCGGCTVTCPGTGCVDGLCAPCDPNETACSDACADLMTDPDHCGSCQNACPSGVACVAGVCDCGGGLEGCGGACVDTDTDTSHCGACFHGCPSGVSCVAGSCVCPGGATLCGNTCTNTDVDPSHCGDCTTTCQPGHACVAGHCN